MEGCTAKRKEGGWKEHKKGNRNRRRNGQKLNSDCLLDKMLVFTQMTDIIVRSN